VAGGRLRIVYRVGGAAMAPTVLRIRITGLASLHVSLGVFCQVVRSHESLIAGGAGEPLLSGVSPEMSL